MEEEKKYNKVTKIEPYNKNAVFKTVLLPIIRELQYQAWKHKIPLFGTVADKSDANHTHYMSRAITPSALEVALKDDKIKEHIMVQNGYKATRPLLYEDMSEDVELDIDNIPEIIKNNNNEVDQ